jgi:DNA-binding NtrC family response regulator
MMPRFLVVDDEPDVCWALENVLRDAGYEVTTAGSKQEAWSLLVGGDFQVAFVDAKLPDGDGIELALEVQQRALTVAVVLVSAYYYAEDRMVQESLKRGLLIGFIPKPFMLDEVRQMAKFGVEISRLRREAC